MAEILENGTIEPTAHPFVEDLPEGITWRATLSRIRAVLGEPDTRPHEPRNCVSWTVATPAGWVQIVGFTGASFAQEHENAEHVWTVEFADPAVFRWIALIMELVLQRS